MSNTSNFRQAIRDASDQRILGPNVIANALPFLGVGLVLTAVGTYGGLGVLRSSPNIFMPSLIVAVIAQFALFFLASNVAQKGNNSTAGPLLAVYSLLTGYTLSGIIFVALNTSGVGLQGIGFSAVACGITFIAARSIGSNLSEKDGLAFSKTISLGVIALVIVLVGQLLLSFFGIYTPTWLEIAISGLGVFLFAGAAVVDFFVLPRSYRDDQYLSVALSMYLTYINLFVFLLRLLIALNSRD